ncbi:MAG: sulfatase [Pirellulales bacterium]|nr:sulfatase [Pirellulales bacterium]
MFPMRGLLLSATALLAGFFLVVAVGDVEAESTARPNILLIVSEDNGPELSCYGEPYVKTPVLDRLAEGGIRFNRAYVTQAGCSQSRASILTGLYPHQHGQIGLATWNSRLYRDRTPNIVRSLKAAGYRTGIIGKLHVNPESNFPFDFAKIPDSNFRRKGLKRYAAEAEKFINASEKPFFLYVNYPDAHRPFLRQVAGMPQKPLSTADVKPLAYIGLDSPALRKDTANYYNSMNRLDTLVGRLLTVLRRSGKFDDTLIVYLGDHGADLLRGKRTCYEGGVRVPLIVHWTGHVAPGQVRSELVSTVDLAPTFLSVAGAKPIPGLPGRSLEPLFGAGDAPWREHLFTEYHFHSAHDFYPQRAVRTDRFKLIHSLLPGQENPDYRFTLDSRYPGDDKVIANAPERIRNAYALMQRPPEYQLYDLANDPYEFRDLSADPERATVLGELKQALADWRRQTGDPLLVPENVARLKAEIDASFKDGKPDRRRLKLTYPDYFFEKRSGDSGEN